MRKKNKLFTRAISAVLSFGMALSLAVPVAAESEVAEGGVEPGTPNPVIQETDPGGNCTHNHLSYIDNEDGTHREVCVDCNEVIEVFLPHDGTDKCVCGYSKEDPVPEYPDGDGNNDGVIIEVPAEEPDENFHVTCPHGKTLGEQCAACGELAHSSKNIPLIGYEQEFFDQVNPDENEGWLLYTIRLVCPHGTADGVYCEKCGHVVDNDPADLPMCTILDCCIHGHVKGEKCKACQELKEEQGDYELANGEAWDDPLIYATEPMQYVSDISYIFNQNRYCEWCDDGAHVGVSRVLGDAWNVHCHVDPNGKYHWDYIARVEGSGTCESHTVTVVYRCGARESARSHSHACTYGGTKHEHSSIITQPTCLKEGRRQTYYTQTCVNCGSESSAMGNKSEAIPTLEHIITGYTYVDSDTHSAECSGNETSAHSMTEKHNFQAEGEDYKCTGCDAVKTTVHVDAYSEDGALLKGDLVTDVIEVGHNGPATVSIQNYLEQAQKAVSESEGLTPASEQADSATVQEGGIHLKYICKEIDSIAVKDYQDTYYYKSDFEDKGTIIVTYKDGTTEEIPLTKDKVVSGFETDPVGEKTLTVNYNGMTTSYDIQVIYQPAMIKVIVPEGYAQSKIGTIVIIGDGDFVTFPDGSTKPCDEVKEYLFTENGTFSFIVTGKDSGTNTDVVTMDWIDDEAPVLTAAIEDGKIIIKSYDDKSGLKTVTYFEAIDTTDTPLQFVGEENQKIIEADTAGVAYGVYRFVATDHAGNSRNFDIAINVDDPVDNTPFSMYVPSSISFYVDKEGSVTYIPEDTKIYNGSETKPICIKAINVSTLGDWHLVDYNTDFSQYAKDSSYVAMSINGCPVNTNGAVKINAEDWVIAADGTLDLALDIKVPNQTETRELPDVLRINFTGDWYSKDDVIGEKHLVTIIPSDKANLSPNVTGVYTNNFGRITYLPRVIPAKGYFAFVKWTNAETLEEVKVGQILTGDISISPEMMTVGTVNLSSTSVEVDEGETTTLTVSWSDCIEGQAVKEIKVEDNKVATVSVSSKNPTSCVLLVESGIEGTTSITITMADDRVLECSLTVNRKNILPPTWGSVDLPAIVSNNRSTSQWGNIAYGGGKFVVIAGGSYGNYYGNRQTAYSTDGKRWLLGGSLPTSQKWNSVAYGNGLFVAVGEQSPSGASSKDTGKATSNVAAYSTDGITWTKSTLPRMAEWEEISYDQNNNQFVAYGSYNAGTGSNWNWKHYNAFSTDAVNWTCTEGSRVYVSSALVTGNGVYLKRGSTTNTLAYSQNGSTWNETEILPFDNLSSTIQTIAYLDGVFIAVKRDEMIYSRDGINWEKGENMPIGEDNNLGYFRFAIGNGILVGLDYSCEVSCKEIFYLLPQKG